MLLAQASPLDMQNQDATPQVANLPTTLEEPAIPPANFRSRLPVFHIETRIRIFEVVLVCVIAFGGSILHSVAVCFGLPIGRSGVGTLTWLQMGMLEAAALGLVWYILRRRSLSFKDLGFSWTKKDVAWSFPVWLLGTLLGSVAYYAMYSAGFASATGSPETTRVTAMLFGRRVPLVIIPLLFLNPFFEEVVARAYVMTEVRQLTKSVSAAVILSTLLQISYHLYQGIPMALSEGALFLVFSLFYAKTNRLTPIILAHFYADLLSISRLWVAQG